MGATGESGLVILPQPTLTGKHFDLTCAVRPLGRRRSDDRGTVSLFVSSVLGAAQHKLPRPAWSSSFEPSFAIQSHRKNSRGRL